MLTGGRCFQCIKGTRAMMISIPSRPETSGFSLNLATGNCFRHLEHPRVALCAMKPATFRAAGMSHAIHINATSTA